MFDKYSDKDGCLGVIGAACLMIIILAAVYLFQAWIGQWLWNDIVGMDTLFGLPELGFWEMYGLIWLAHIIFPSNTRWSSSKN